MGILTEEMQRLVRRIRLGYVATVCPDGTPNLSPKGTTTVWDEDHLVFADLRSPNTVANLRHNPMVEINVVDPILRKGYRFKGRAQVFSEGDLYEQILAFYEQRGTARERIRSVVLVRVERARPLTSPAYDQDISEDEVRRHWESYYASPEGSSTRDAQV
jgi:predicted pyridoxine 5'-phosphate oxidase superfamily flavin-nucleotide-binding protein